jgi:hypothetical protein
MEVQCSHRPSSRTTEDLIGRAHPDLVRPLQVLDRVGIHAWRRVLAGRLERRVRLRLVEEVRRDLCPRLFRVVGHVQEGRALRHHHEPTGEADAVGFLAIRGVQHRVGVHRHHREPKARRAPRRGGHSPADEHGRVRFGRGHGGDAHGAAFPLERLTRPRLQHRRNLFLEDLAAPCVVDPCHLELVDAIPGAEHRPQPAGERVVDHRDLLGDADRVVQRQDRRRQQDRRTVRHREGCSRRS